MKRREINDLIAALEAQGFQVSWTKSQHLRVVKAGVPVATMSGTPSDHRAIKNFMAYLKRAGFQPS